MSAAAVAPARSLDQPMMRGRISDNASETVLPIIREVMVVSSCRFFILPLAIARSGCRGSRSLVFHRVSVYSMQSGFTDDNRHIG